jgi:hypothetical protein
LPIDCPVFSHFFPAAVLAELSVGARQASIKTLKAVTGLVIGDLATAHWQKVACSCGRPGA